MRLILLLAWVVIETLLLLRLAKLGSGWLVLLYLLAAAVAGTAVIRRHGYRALQEVRLATARGELPTAALLEGLLGFIAGLLLILPGILSDLLAVLLLVPGLRRRLARTLDRRVAQARPDLRQPVVIEGEYRETPTVRRELPPGSG